jgi:hypothetical protein
VGGFLFFINFLFFIKWTKIPAKNNPNTNPSGYIVDKFNLDCLQISIKVDKI